VRVERGHLVLEDGIGVRRKRRFPRVGHGIRRLVVIGSDGMVSLAALRWLADQDAAFVMLERDGSVLATTGPVRSSDARLRRAQSLAIHTGVAVEIARELMIRKLVGQEKVIREQFHKPLIADEIARNRESLKSANTMSLVRQFESQAAHAYWSAWRTVSVMFPQRDVNRVPIHWGTFGTRKSPISGSPRLAVNPLNAMLNYLYAVLESESRLALAALGLDPGIGFLHLDAPARDSLACDLMEAIRPEVDAYLFNWISREPLRRNWFFEQSDGTCRLMGSFAVQLSQTAATWGRAVAPVAEWVSRKLWSRLRKSRREIAPATRLTQSQRREAKGGSIDSGFEVAPSAPRICRVCGKDLTRGRSYCAKCAAQVAKGNLIKIAKLGRVATHAPEAEARRAETMRRQQNANLAWNASDKPDWLTEEFYREKIQSRLDGITVSTMASALCISKPYATDIRRGTRVPHPRHWQSLARLVSVSPD
jgi:CRISPR-associated endonuclease Cas1